MTLKSAFLLGVFTFQSFTFAFVQERQSGKKISKSTKPISILLSKPRAGWTVDRMVEVAGKVSDVEVDPITININGDKYLIRTINGEFKRKFPVTQGKNYIEVSASNKAGIFTERKSIFAKIPSLPFLAILTSDTDNVYTDLHVYEPGLSEADPNAKPTAHIYWADTSSASGGKFYLNEQGGNFDQPGYGPYLYTHSSPPTGIYRIDANYWPSGDKAHTLSTLNLTLFGGTSNEVKKRVQVPLVTPGETVTLAYVRIQKGNSINVYVPAVDQKPKRGEWPEWVLDAPLTRKGTEN
ncbi:MAG: DUF2135 domain-containing protein [Bdellovibrionaceae bacterium]|nr:DUF2135 domain-containing protein [Pseudobdellovibrionaceae bacterium]